MSQSLETKAISVRIPLVIFNKLGDLAARTHKTKTSFIKQALIEKMEDLIDYQECLNIIKESYPEDYLSHVEAWKEIGI